jgi:hypothetical protein
MEPGMFRHFTSLITLLATSLLALAASPLRAASPPADIPAGYALVYQQDFEKPSSIADFRFTDPSVWRLAADGDNHFLELFAKSDYKPVHRSPFNIALLATKQVGSFVLEADLLQTSREYGHRDMVAVFAVTDPSHFYYAHIATKADPHAHQLFIVNDAPRVAITAEGTPGFDWGKNAWQKLRIVHDAATGHIAVYMNDMTKPLLTATDKNFDMGWMGFGSFDDTGRVDNIRIYAPASTDKQADFFKSK